MKFLLYSLLALLNYPAIAQVLTIHCTDVVTQLPLRAVSVQVNGQKMTRTDSSGNCIVSIKNTAKLRLTYVGYMALQTTIAVTQDSTVNLQLQPMPGLLGDVTVVASTRSNDRIENSTNRVEVLGLEEMNEESTIKPGNIASILGDISGIQMQQSSATSGNTNVRIQGLDGRYTQLLRDGMPLFEGYSGGFGVLSIPPLDLKQIELIKGSSSTLYGGGAIGGLVNLISKRPAFTPDASFLINQTTLKETNVNAYYAQRWKRVGFTLFAGQTFQQEVDVNKDGFSDVPDTKSSLLHPVLFFYPSERSWLSLGWSGSLEDRKGGDMIVIAGKPSPSHTYYEKNRLTRNTFTLMGENRYANNLTSTIKASLSVFQRAENTNTYNFNGTQHNFYTEATLVKRITHHTIVGGINITGNSFKPSIATPAPVGNFSNTTIGAFMQDTWQLLNSTKLETGLRFDHHNKYGDFLLPRVALFHRFNEQWGSRMSFGMGYTTPNPLTPQIRDYSIYQLQPIASNVKSEKSYGGSIEVNFKKEFGDGDEKESFFINHAFFLTQINAPIVASEDISGNVSFSNQNKPLLTKGFDTYIQLQIDEWEIYAGYTYTEALRRYLTQKQFVPITPRHRAATTLVYEIEGKGRIGLEASYTGAQYREDYTKTPDYIFVAAMAEKKFGPKWSLVLNCENLLDKRQSSYESLYTGTISNPTFKTLWAPIDGRVINVCLRFQPFAKTTF